MIVYVGAGSANPGTFREFVAALGHGQMVSRQTGAFRIPREGIWAFDNGAWTDFKNGVPFNDKQFLWRVRRLQALPDEYLPQWCVCPDAVGERQSLEYSLEWKSVLAETAPRLQWYLAIQNYTNPNDVIHALSLEAFDGLFIGGSDDKWRDDTMPMWVELGHQMGLPVHIGRINGLPRLQWAVNVGADSVDGTGWVKAGKRWVEHLITLPKPTTVLVPEDKVVQEDWLKFGEFLVENYPTIEEWHGRLPEDPAEDPHYERYARIGKMTPPEFVYWIGISYPGLYGHDEELIAEAKTLTPEEFHDWKLEMVEVAERHFGIKPVPPTPFTPSKGEA